METTEYQLPPLPIPASMLSHRECIYSETQMRAYARTAVAKYVIDGSYTDEIGTVWTAPTAEAYAKACRALTEIRQALHDECLEKAPLLEEIAAREADSAIKAENLKTLREQNGKLRKALGWTAAVLQCLANDSLSDSSTFTVNGEKRSLVNVLDLADAALGESE